MVIQPSEYAMSPDSLLHLPPALSLAALNRLLLGLGVLVAFWLAAAVTLAVLRRVAARSEGGRRDVLRLAGRALYVSLLVIGIVSALGTVGINVGAMIASLGLIGFALGFALKDTLSNLLSGVMILLYRPFRIGDRIAAAGLEGIVASIDLRYTTLSAEDRRLLLPNSMLFTNTITVYEDAAPHVDA